MNWRKSLLACWFILVSAFGAAGPKQATLASKAQSSDEAAWLEDFKDGISHWQKKLDKSDYPRLRPQQVGEIADNMLLYQRANGGWPKDLDPSRILTPEERRTVSTEKSRLNTTFDNRTSYTQTEYLARAYGRTGDEKYRDGCLRGLRFILSAQYSNGGWPHTFPDRKGYYPRVTIVDDVMVGVLRTVRRAASRAEPFGFLDASIREQCQKALEAGDACLLRLQLPAGGWAPQYDEKTLEPCLGRSFELPSLISAESVGVTRYLMEIEPQTQQTRAAIARAVAWFERSKLRGIKLRRVPAPTQRYDNHTSRDDVVVVEDPHAPPIWARFYELDSNRPFMANRDGKKVYSLAEVERERRTGYSWYSYSPAKLLEQDYPQWLRRHPDVR